MKEEVLTVKFDFKTLLKLVDANSSHPDAFLHRLLTLDFRTETDKDQQETFESFILDFHRVFRPEHFGCTTEEFKEITGKVQALAKKNSSESIQTLFKLFENIITDETLRWICVRWANQSRLYGLPAFIPMYLSQKKLAFQETSRKTTVASETLKISFTGGLYHLCSTPKLDQKGDPTPSVILTFDLTLSKKGVEPQLDLILMGDTKILFDALWLLRESQHLIDDMAVYINFLKENYKAVLLIVLAQTKKFKSIVQLPIVTINEDFLLEFSKCKKLFLQTGNIQLDKIKKDFSIFYSLQKSQRSLQHAQTQMIDMKAQRNPSGDELIYLEKYLGGLGVCLDALTKLLKNPHSIEKNSADKLLKEAEFYVDFKLADEKRQFLLDVEAKINKLNGKINPILDFQQKSKATFDSRQSTEEKSPLPEVGQRSQNSPAKKSSFFVDTSLVTIKKSPSHMEISSGSLTEIKTKKSSNWGSLLNLFPTKEITKKDSKSGSFSTVNLTYDYTGPDFEMKILISFRDKLLLLSKEAVILTNPLKECQAKFEGLVETYSEAAMLRITTLFMRVDRLANVCKKVLGGQETENENKRNMNSVLERFCGVLTEKNHELLLKIENGEFAPVEVEEIFIETYKEAYAKYFPTGVTSAFPPQIVEIIKKLSIAAGLATEEKESEEVYDLNGNEIDIQNVFTTPISTPRGSEPGSRPMFIKK